MKNYAELRGHMLRILFNPEQNQFITGFVPHSFMASSSTASPAEEYKSENIVPLRRSRSFHTHEASPAAHSKSYKAI